MLHGELTTLGDAKSVQVGFEYRNYGGFIGDYLESRDTLRWTRTALVTLTKPGPFTMRIRRPSRTADVTLRAVALHPKGLTVEGNEARVAGDGTVSLP